MQLALKDCRLGLRNSQTRIPFRYGSACMTACPQGVFQVIVESGGRRQVGFSGDCLPPRWFDKSPDKDYAEQLADMFRAVALAERVYLDEFAAPRAFFDGWLVAQGRIQQLVAELNLPPLLASFAASLPERALLDAMCRLAGANFSVAARQNLLGLEPGAVHGRLAGSEPRDWLPAQPPQSVFVRHTVGLGDPLTAADVPECDRLRDGAPQTLEEYLARTGTRYFKIKVSNQLDADLERLATIARLVERQRGSDYRVTLDGNEQYQRAEQFDELVEVLAATPALTTLWNNTLVVEQPLERSIALDPAHTAGIRRLCRSKPVIIDESDGTIDSYSQALELGYRGVSSKSCKGAVKSLLNAGLTVQHNRQPGRLPCVMTGEDLCTVGIIAVQSDLCLAAALGLNHVERNGHHYHAGIGYLPERDQAAALREHADFYLRQDGRVAPRLADGCFQIGSLLDRPGMGFCVLPDMHDWVPPDDWRYDSLASA